MLAPLPPPPAVESNLSFVLGYRHYALAVKDCYGEAGAGPLAPCLAGLVAAPLPGAPSHCVPRPSAVPSGGPLLGPDTRAPPAARCTGLTGCLAGRAVLLQGGSTSS